MSMAVGPPFPTCRGSEMASSTPLRPQTVDDVRDAVAEAMASGTVIEVRGGGSKAEIGAPRQTRLLDLSAFDQVVDYDPRELVLTVGAGMRLDRVEALLAEHSQMLAFEPFDHGPLLGGTTGRATLGGVIAAGVAGSRRLSAGAARDHFLGFEAVSGRAERFVGGARVVKNVTGYDLPKVMAGSWGRLAVLTTVTLKVLPRPEATVTLALRGLDDRGAVRAMALAMRSHVAVAAAAHLPDHEAGPLTLLRLEGFGPSLSVRAAALATALAGSAAVETLGQDDAAPLWTDLRDAAPLAGEAVLWRVNTAPSLGPQVVEALIPHGARRLYDWAGGLVWLGTREDVDPALVRAAAQAAGGHATLVRAPAALRAKVPALHPEQLGVARLSDRLKAAFDPAGVLDPHRFKV